MLSVADLATAIVYVTPLGLAHYLAHYIENSERLFCVSVRIERIGHNGSLHVMVPRTYVRTQHNATRTRTLSHAHPHSHARTSPTYFLLPDYLAIIITPPRFAGALGINADRCKEDICQYFSVDLFRHPPFCYCSCTKMKDLQSLSGIYFPTASFLWTDAIAFFVYRSMLRIYC